MYVRTFFQSNSCSCWIAPSASVRTQQKLFLLHPWAAPCAHTGTHSPHWGKLCTPERAPKSSRFHGNCKAFGWSKSLEIRSLPTAFEGAGSTALVQDYWGVLCKHLCVHFLFPCSAPASHSSKFISLCHINSIAVISLGSESLNYTLNLLSMISQYCYSMSH